MGKLYTHVSIDLDAVASAWAWLRFVNSDFDLCFVSAQWNGAEMKDDDIALDIEAGGRGVKSGKDEEGEFSCFRWVVENHLDENDRIAIDPLVQFIDAQDASGNAAKAFGVEGEVRKIWSFTGINAVLRAFQRMTSFGPDHDFLVCQKMFEVFDGFWRNGLSRQEAVEEAERAERFTDSIVIVRNNKRRGTNGYLFENGAKIIIFIDGNNLGIIRKDNLTIRMDHDLIREATRGEEGWFFHPDGWLTARGTRKAPAENPSSVSPYDLARAAHRLLQSEV